jgi:hypothetical protein
MALFSNRSLVPLFEVLVVVSLLGGSNADFFGNTNKDSNSGSFGFSGTSGNNNFQAQANVHQGSFKTARFQARMRLVL